jgi:hypothetical protein
VPRPKPWPITTVTSIWPNLIAAGIAAALGAAAVPAQTLAERVSQCAQVQDRTSRLSCYDHLAADISGRGAAPQASPVPAAPTTSSAPAVPAASGATPATAEANFGVSGGPLAAKRQAVALKEIAGRVTRVAARPRGELVITLENGQVWQQHEASESFELKVGDEVQIQSGALGSYIMISPSKRGTKVTRIR